MRRDDMTPPGIPDAGARRCVIIPVSTSAGAPTQGCANGPGVLLERGLAAALTSDFAVLRPAPTIVDRAGQPDRMQRVASIANELAAATTAAARQNELPIVLGGDHSIAAGTWRGIAAAHDGPIGLLWIDAHLDAHTLDTTPSGEPHGMPLAALLGFGDARLTGTCPALAPEHVAVVGVRSFEPDEAALLMTQGVRVFGMSEIARRGLAAVMRDALEIVGRGTVGFGVSIDLDVVDPQDAPGVTTPAAAGIRSAALLEALALVHRRSGLVGVEVAEYDPSRDPDHRTSTLAIRAIAAMIGTDPHAARRLIKLEAQHGAHNYAPLPVVLARGDGVHLWDVAGKRYLDMMSAYSAVSLGHAHPRILGVLRDQAATLAVTSRAYFNDRLPRLLARLTELTGLDQALPVNTGLEAVETALKAARKWGYKIKGIPPDRAGIIACAGNFHGRSITIVGMSSEPQYREGFGPFPPGFTLIPFGDARALERAITPDTAAFLVEPIQGEGGIIVPPGGYLAECARICRERNVLLIVDEVQTGLARTGRFLACEHEGVRPDGVILGKALGGGVLPVSAFVGRREVMQVFRPGDHGSTFGGNPLAAAVALEALNTIVDERLVERAAELGRHFKARLAALDSPLIRDVRGVGLLIGVDLDPARADARTACERLMTRGVLSKDTHGTVIRFAPPLVIERAEIDWAVDQVSAVLAEMERVEDRMAVS